MQIPVLSKRARAVRKTHYCRKAVSLADPGYKKAVIDFFTSSISQDLNPKGDISTIALGSRASKKVTALIIAKCAGVAAGFEEAAFIFKRRYPFFRHKISFKPLIQDGDKIKQGQGLAVLAGAANDLLAAERTLLNFLQRMGGIATLTSEYVKAVPLNVLVAPTRKTLCGLLDKKSVTVGGGGTHRINLSDAILIKDNHLKLLHGNLNALFDLLSEAKLKGRFIEIEVTSVNQAIEAINFHSLFSRKRFCRVPFFLMFDNFKPAEIRKVIHAAKKTGTCENIFFEASGGINGKNILSYAKSGVDVISSGALTHSAPALDISLEIDI